MSPAAVPVLLRDLVEQTGWLEAGVPLAEVQVELTRRRVRFLGITERGRFVGVANGREIAELLSRQFGHAVFGRQPVRDHVMARPMVVRPDTPLTELLKLVSGRGEDAFYDDIALIGAANEFIGLIPVHRLVRLQTSLLLANLAEIEGQRRELAARNRRMEEDLRMARGVQLALLPGRPTRLMWSGRVVEARHVYEPTDLIGGDYFAVFSPAAGTLACCVCDVMGHGVRPALITAMLRALIEQSQALATDPGAMLTHLNRSLQSVLESAGAELFVTAGYAVIDLPGGKLRYAHAGHPRPLLWRAAARTVTLLELEAASAGPALGLLEDPEYAATATDFAPGDALLLYTDGVVEVLGPDGTEFGPDRLLAAYAQAMQGDPAGAAPAAVDAARQFAGAAGFTDDVCVIAIRGVPPGAVGEGPAP